MNLNETASEAFRNAAIHEAEACLAIQIPELPDPLYSEFAITGNRTHFESANFLRRRVLNRLVLGELCEAGGRFLPDIEKMARLTLEEKTWVLPAHSGGQLPNGREENIDLFSSQTAAALSIISISFPLNQELQTSIWQAVSERIFKPFLAHDYWWRDLGRSRRQVPSNWTPWCIHGVLECVRAAQTILAVKTGDATYCLPQIPGIQPGQLEQIFDGCLASLSNYFEDYPEDGGCDEGVQYWEHSVGHFFECNMHKYFSGETKKLSAMYSFPEKAHLTGSYYMNFADCAARTTPNASMIFLMGREIGSARLQAFGAFLYRQAQKGRECGAPGLTLRDNMDLRAVLDAAAVSADIETYPARLSHKQYDFFPSLDAAVFRGPHFCAAAKGGHNGENHNHNDCGNIILYADGRPLLIDAGVGAYTKDTFSERRYSIWTMQSSFHNLPEINGCMQQDGAQYAADQSSFTPHGFSSSIARAYPPEAGIRTLQRKLELSKSSVRITSEFGFASENNIIHLNYMLPSPPRLDGRQAAALDGYTIMLPPAEWVVEKIEFGGDEKLSPVWGNALYRLRGKITVPLNQFTAVTTIHCPKAIKMDEKGNISIKTDEYYMGKAVEQAKKAAACGDVPIGCVLVKDGQIVSRAYNRRNKDHSVLAHAEMLAIEKAAKRQGDFRLDGFTMYVTLEPCQMCAGAIIQSRIKRVVIGAMNPKAGCAGSVLNLLQVPRFNHQAEITNGICGQECSSLLTNFFRDMRK